MKIGLLFLILFFLVVCKGTGQILQGYIKTLEEKPVSQAHVILLNSDLKVVAHAISGDDGFFLIQAVEKGMYKLNISCVGFEILQQNILIEGNRGDLGVFRMKKGITLDEVSVIKEKKLLTTEVDKIVYDVSHQSYPHKMLTGRKDAFLYEDKYDDVSGYSNPDESDHDFFTIGHTSTSVSLACGLAKGRDLKGDSENIIVVIGDGSLSGGEALEGLDFASELNSNLIIVVNDNDMSIAENHGGLYKNLKQLRDTDGKSECNLFKSMGLDYVFVKDGNDIDSLITAFEQVKDSTYPVVVHICTQKGKGYKIAEENKENWHYCGPFNLETGKSDMSQDGGEDYSSMTADILLKKMKEDKTVVGITSATPTVFGFTEDKRKEAGSQFVDVGIAEETAVALASGIAKSGGKQL